MITRVISLAMIGALLAGCNAIPTSSQGGKARSAKVPIATSAEARQCLSSLADAGARFSALPDLQDAGGCRAINSVRLDRLAGDRNTFSLTGLNRVSCPVANSFGGWARFGVDRAARAHLGAELVEIVTMGSYACRNVAGTGRLSAHAKAEAIDIAAFKLSDGRRVSVLKGWDSSDPAERAFLKAVHRSACKRFGTVLGPDYNAAHRDHLHIERSGGGFCR